MSGSDRSFSWFSFTIGALTGGVATFVLGIVLMTILAIVSINAVGIESDSQGTASETGTAVFEADYDPAQPS